MPLSQVSVNIMSWVLSCPGELGRVAQVVVKGTTLYAAGQRQARDLLPLPFVMHADASDKYDLVLPPRNP